MATNFEHQRIFSLTQINLIAALLNSGLKSDLKEGAFINSTKIVNGSSDFLVGHFGIKL